ncbi:hypothetical protein, partial [uncultured Pseudoflavonifractor sp.]|uniref:hypothetical protein n=1 Tax=uncultured Pseudoflavonifractor sp. TaxID=1221379 RepID=UPI0025DFC496
PMAEGRTHRCSGYEEAEYEQGHVLPESSVYRFLPSGKITPKEASHDKASPQFSRLPDMAELL